MNFQRERLTVNGVDVVMLAAGSGPPLLFLHGAGTWHGFDFALPWAKHHRVMIPYHPGWGESGDCEAMTTVHDYVMHYLELIDQLGLDRVDLVGLSMGGRLAATFTAEHRRRVRRLVLVAPAGLDVPGHPLADFTKIPPEDIPAWLTEDVPALLRHAPAHPGPEWLAAREREAGSFFKLLGTGLTDPKFARWLHRVTVPALLVWGEQDRVTPIQQADLWIKHVPGLRFHSVPGAGHLVLDEKPEAVEVIGRFLRA
jgi:pimeloyl-ACP methyl ester carboxylesterase